MNTQSNNDDIETKQRRKALRKRAASKLDPFTEPLVQMEVENKTIDQMLAWLQERGVTTARGNLSHFLKRRREEAELKALKEELQTKLNKREAMEEWLVENPKPDAGTVTEMFKMVAMELALEEAKDPKLLKLADRLTRTALGHVNDQSREAYRTRRLALEEAIRADRAKCEQTRGTELRRDRAIKHPSSADILRRLFDKLGERRKEGNGE